MKFIPKFLVPKKSLRTGLPGSIPCCQNHGCFWDGFNCGVEAMPAPCLMDIWESSLRTSDCAKSVQKVTHQTPQLRTLDPENMDVLGMFSEAGGGDYRKWTYDTESLTYTVKYIKPLCMRLDPGILRMASRSPCLHILHETWPTNAQKGSPDPCQNRLLVRFGFVTTIRAALWSNVWFRLHVRVGPAMLRKVLSHVKIDFLVYQYPEGPSSLISSLDLMCFMMQHQVPWHQELIQLPLGREMHSGKKQWGFLKTLVPNSFCLAFTGMGFLQTRVPDFFFTSFSQTATRNYPLMYFFPLLSYIYLPSKYWIKGVSFFMSFHSAAPLPLLFPTDKYAYSILRPYATLVP